MKTEYVLILKMTHEKTQETQIVGRKVERKTYVYEKLKEHQWEELVLDPIDVAQMELLAVITDPSFFLENQEDIEKLLKYFAKKQQKLEDVVAKNE